MMIRRDMLSMGSTFTLPPVLGAALKSAGMPAKVQILGVLVAHFVAYGFLLPWKDRIAFQ